MNWNESIGAFSYRFFLLFNQLQKTGAYVKTIYVKRVKSAYPLEYLTNMETGERTYFNCHLWIAEVEHDTTDVDISHLEIEYESLYLHHLIIYNKLNCRIYEF